MKQKKLIIDWSDILTQCVIVFSMLFIPLLVFVATGQTWLQAFFNLRYTLPPMMILLGGFLVNYYWLVPKYIINERSSWRYALFCALTYFLLYFGAHQLAVFFYPADRVNEIGLPKIGVEFALAYELGNLLVNLLFVLAAFSLRFQQHNRFLKLKQAEQEKEAAQNELLRLKGQLNPHFLFNTLNNISSLSAFDPDATQESISRLSDMLRYVLYDSSTEKVPLYKDMDFMHNYINLMQIRYEDTLKLDVQMQVSDSERQIPPMLFISLLENAYKYGASSLHECRLTVRLGDEGGALRFFIENTLLSAQEMMSKKHGGVGLVNLEKRLSLMYPGQYTFTHGETEDATYRAEIVINES